MGTEDTCLAEETEDTAAFDPTCDAANDWECNCPSTVFSPVRVLGTSTQTRQFFVFAPLIEPAWYFSVSYRESNKEITRAWVMDRDNRDFRAKSTGHAHGGPRVDVSRDRGRESEPKRASSQRLAETGDGTKNARAESLSFVC